MLASEIWSRIEKYLHVFINRREGGRRDKSVSKMEEDETFPCLMNFLNLEEHAELRKYMVILFR